MSRLLMALAFLTRLPVPVPPGAGPREVARGMAAFPLVGGLVGAALAGAAVLLARVLPPALAATLAVALGALLTGALHLDGLADAADALGAGADRERALRIMRDHHLGTYGAAALVLSLLAKVAALAALLSAGGALSWWPVAAALGRWIMVPLAALAPAARPDGLGASVGAHVGRVELVVATALAFAIAGALARWSGLAALAAVALLGGWMARACRRRFGGMTGDTLGASAELSELLVLILGCAWGVP
jgi:adenosylcobinamide-GDP ribazoletransferase